MVPQHKLAPSMPTSHMSVASNLVGPLLIYFPANALDKALESMWIIEPTSRVQVRKYPKKYTKIHIQGLSIKRQY